MNNDLFQQAKAKSSASDYKGALELYTQCLQDQTHPLEPGETGLVYHKMGNCLTKMKDFRGAIQAYTEAAGDTAYDACGTVNYNLGMAYAALRDYDDAIKHFEIAVSDGKYLTPYKAYMGMGNALLRQGKSAEAGVAFREAALDEANPDPTKALLNLGVCFMSLDRPADAVTSYESALQFDMNPDTRNKLEASLGQAYVACGQMQNAVNAFESAIADKTYFLSASASVDYQRAIAAVSQGTDELTQSLPPVAADTSGIDVVTTDEEIYPNDQEAYAPAPQQPTSPYYMADAYGSPEAQQEADDRFFTASDDELEKWSRGEAKKERKRKSSGLKALVVVIVIVVVLLAAGVFAYTQGYGYPMQQTVAEALFNDSTSDVYASSLSSSDIATIQNTIPSGVQTSVAGVDRGMATSTVYVTATTSQGSDLTYQVSMVREGIGWKVSGVDLYFASEN